MMMNHVVGNAFAAQHNVDKLSPSRTVVTSFNPKKSSTLNDSDYFDEGDWVLCVATNEERQKVGCALSNGEVQIYDQNTLQHLHTYQRNSSLVIHSIQIFWQQQRTMEVSHCMTFDNQ
jgi:hypothetical protein